jgi:hypothetical protein
MTSLKQAVNHILQIKQPETGLDVEVTGQWCSTSGNTIIAFGDHYPRAAVILGDKVVFDGRQWVPGKRARVIIKEVS